MTDKECIESLRKEGIDLRKLNAKLTESCTKLAREYEELTKKAEEYRDLYLAELQKRLDLAARVRELEKRYAIYEEE